MRTRVVFMGTPDFAVPSLEAVAALPGVEVVCVVTQPDRRAGRGQQLQPSPVKARARAMGMLVWAPDSLKHAEEQARLRALAPDVLVVVAYGEILRRAVLEIPAHGALNVHASLLPRHRGAAPIVGALLAGDEETGVTVMLMDRGMDTGPILATRTLSVRPAHTRDTLTEELARLGAGLLAETLPRWLAGQIVPQPQPTEGATYTRLIRKEDGQLDWSRPRPRAGQSGARLRPLARDECRVGGQAAEGAGGGCVGWGGGSAAVGATGHRGACGQRGARGHGAGVAGAAAPAACWRKAGGR